MVFLFFGSSMVSPHRKYYYVRLCVGVYLLSLFLSNILRHKKDEINTKSSLRGCIATCRRIYILGAVDIYYILQWGEYISSGFNGPNGKSVLKQDASH